MNGLIKKLMLLVLALTVFLAGCGTTPESFAQSYYNLVDAQTNGSSVQKVYQAANQTVPEVAQQLAAQNKPEQMSQQSNQEMFLVYPDQVIHLQQDPQKSTDVLVEIDSIQFVRDHYDPSFMQSFLAGAILGHIFGSNWRYSPNYGSGYRGYGYSHYGPYSGGSYKPPSTTPPSTYTPPKSNTGKGTVIPRSGSGTNKSSGSSGSYTTPPKSSGGYTTPPRKSGGSFFSPPRSSGGRGGVVRRR